MTVNLRHYGLDVASHIQIILECRQMPVCCCSQALQPVRYGVLWKRSRWTGSWLPRWYMLRGQSFTYSSSAKVMPHMTFKPYA